MPIDSRWVDTASLMQAADASCYSAKEAGRNRVHEWVETHERMQERQWDTQWIARLESALDERQFQLYGQRIASCGMSEAADFINAMRSLGIRVALDDFGAGAASFGYLKNLRVDTLKIDGQFIRDLLHDRLDHTAVCCFRDVAAVCGLKTIAGFVKTKEVLIELQRINIDFAQGFFIHRPEPLARLMPMPRAVNMMQ